MDKNGIVTMVIARNYVNNAYEESGGMFPELGDILCQLNLFILKNCAHVYISDEIELSNNIDNPISRVISYCVICQGTEQSSETGPMNRNG
jgi:hypothetical protein